MGKGGINRFNGLTSKEWLPFQKSWYRFSELEQLYEQNFRFFCKAEPDESVVAYNGNGLEIAADVAEKNNIKFKAVTSVTTEDVVQYALIDLLAEVDEKLKIEDYQKLKERVMVFVKLLYDQLEHRRFLTVLIPNIYVDGKFFPFAWDLAQEISTVFSLKDEKIGCVEAEASEKSSTFFSPQKSVFYSLYFRKDENSVGNHKSTGDKLFYRIEQQEMLKHENKIPQWFILKPQPRKKNEILHPAKYPEDLVEMYLNEFTQPGDNVFDPMSGTGSTQLGALKMGRNGYGTELSEFFCDIANSRCSGFLSLNENKNLNFKILNSDARTASAKNFPPIDYIITSPPYWDMLNMKGAENQAKRVEKGLQTNYSDNEQDLGNISDYNSFLDELCEIYFNVFKLLKPGGHATIVVKNIKKKGRNYPFAWDLAERLQREMILLPETFWCQDDISIAPYGYGNTWVSNTFHQYCLNFQKIS